MISKRNYSRLTLIAGCLLPLWASGADFELIGQDTYLSPSIIGTAPNASAPSRRTLFWTNSILTAVEHHYQYRNEYDDSTNLVGQVLSVVHLNRYQFEASYTRRRALDEGSVRNPDDIPDHRWKAAVGYYFPLLARPSTKPQRTGSPAPAPLTTTDMRVMAGWIRDARRSGRDANELFVDASVKLLPESFVENKTFLTDVHGGYFYSFRPHEHEHFAGYQFRGSFLQWDNGASLGFGISLGTSRKAGDWSWGAYQNHLMLTVPVVRRVWLDCAASISRQVSHGQAWHPQFLLAVRWNAYSKIAKKP